MNVCLSNDSADEAPSNSTQISPGYQKMKNNRLAPHYPGVRRGMGSKPTSRAASDKEKKTKIEIKGVDQILVETIMNEIQDKCVDWFHYQMALRLLVFFFLFFFCFFQGYCCFMG